MERRELVLHGGILLLDQHGCLFIELDAFGLEEVSDATKEICGTLVGAVSASLSFDAALGASFTAAHTVAVVSRAAAVYSLTDGSEDKEEGQVEGEDDCEEGKVGDVLFSEWLDSIIFEFDLHKKGVQGIGRLARKSRLLTLRGGVGVSRVELESVSSRSR